MRVNIISNSFQDVFPTEGENWGLNYEFYRAEKRIEKLFIMDGISGLSAVKDKNIAREEVVEKINEKDLILITPFYEKKINKSESYPLANIKGKYEILYFKSTLAYMLAYAAFYKYDDVRLYGVTQAGHLEYLWERPAVEYWIGVLIGQGAKITNYAKDTRLFGGRPSFGGQTLYGYEMSEYKALKKVKKLKKMDNT